MDILWRKYFQKVSSQSFDILHQSFLYLKHQPGSGTVSSPISGESGEDFVYTVRNQNLHLLIVFIFHPTELKPHRGVFVFFGLLNKREEFYLNQVPALYLLQSVENQVRILFTL